jgi:hypothetical protein
MALVDHDQAIPLEELRRALTSGMRASLVRAGAPESIRVSVVGGSRSVGVHARR